MDTDYNAKSRAAGFFAGSGLVVCQLAINTIDNAFSTGMGTYFDTCSPGVRRAARHTLWERRCSVIFVILDIAARHFRRASESVSRTIFRMLADPTTLHF